MAESPSQEHDLRDTLAIGEEQGARCDGGKRERFAKRALDSHLGGESWRRFTVFQAINPALRWRGL